jgi:hypothetical protein
MKIKYPSCGALHWMTEKKSSSSKSSPRLSICFPGGRVSLTLLQPPPEPLQSLLTFMYRPAVKFREDIWKYNRALSFTSLGVHEDRSVNKGNRPPVFRISGKLHHLSGLLHPLRAVRLATPSSMFIIHRLLLILAWIRTKVWTKASWDHCSRLFWKRCISGADVAARIFQFST